jgi:hypothetical protein
MKVDLSYSLYESFLPINLVALMEHTNSHST